jgi:hypothetical protein
MVKIKCIYIAVLLLIISSCRGKAVVKAGDHPIAVGSVSAEVLGKIERDAIIVSDTVDLKNRVCYIPQGITLVFNKGIIKNGTLIGNKTKIKNRSACFQHVRISGTWNVPVINTDLFTDLSYNNALKDVIALSSPKIKNKITIGNGNYYVTAYKDGEACLKINSNTELVVNGNILLIPNDLKKCHIINVSGNNIKISGNGMIKGDKHTHTGKSGEWGMGINLSKAHHIKLYGLNISDCWGDCIYVGNESTDIEICNCKLDNGRRQGISITSADTVYIKDCVISNVYGTAPEYAIDIEPNKGQTVSNVRIKGVTVNNCIGGIYLCGVASNAEIENVIIRHCKIIGVSKTPIMLQKCNNTLVENIHFERCSGLEPIVKEMAAHSIVRKISVN